MSDFVISFFNGLLGCSHKQTTFPLTECRSGIKRTYVVCLSCGRELDYRWYQMKLVGTAAPRAGRVKWRANCSHAAGSRTWSAGSITGVATKDAQMSAKVKILLVEDELAVRNLCVEMLRCAGYDPIVAADGTEGLRIYRE